jgi:hypothetical protein
MDFSPLQPFFILAYTENLVNQQNPVILSIIAKSNHALPPHGGC